MEYDRIIIGAGLYGLYAALFCAKNHQRILVLEQDSEAFKRATYINQARVHMGYHRWSGFAGRRRRAMTVILVFIMTAMGAFGAYFLKLASAAKSIAGLLKAPALYAGAGLYGLSAVLNIVLLRVLPYSVVLPLTSLTYIWTAIIGWKLLKERISPRMLCGIACIVIGVVILVTAS